MKTNKSRVPRWRAGLAVMVAVSAMAGCATKSTVQTRRSERAAAYAGLAEEQQKLVNEGLIQVGMSEDAVYIAWGKPDQTLRRGDASGESVTWLYHGTTTDEYLSWRYSEVPRPGGRGYLTRQLDRDINVREYVAAELIFRNGQLQSWRMLPKPAENTYFGPTPWY